MIASLTNAAMTEPSTPIQWIHLRLAFAFFVRVVSTEYYSMLFSGAQLHGKFFFPIFMAYTFGPRC